MAPPSSPETFCFPDDGRVPNSALPMIVRRAAVSLDSGDPARSFERMFARNGWTTG